jgi:UDP-glucuronate 4-epimerase
MIILVTGSCGFIGSHVCERLLTLYPNNKLFGIDSLNTFIYDNEQKIKNRELLRTFPNYHHIEDDIMNHNYIIDIKPDIIVHMAGYGNICKSITHPTDYIHNNLNVTTKLLHEIRFLKNCPLFIYASSSSVYGNNYKLPFTETDSLDNIINMYSLSKKMCEDTVDLYCKMYGFRAIGLRMFSVYGPRGRPDMVIHKFFKNLIKGNNIEIFGDGTTQRDYTYIDDIVDGIINCIFYNINYSIGKHTIYNLASSKPIPLIDLLTKCENITRKKSNIIIKPLVLEELKITYGNIRKAQQEINYKPKYNIDYGLYKTYEWFIKNSGIIDNCTINDNMMIVEVNDNIEEKLRSMSI